MAEDIDTRVARLEERDKSQNARLSRIEGHVERTEAVVAEMRTDMRAAKKAGGWLLSVAMAAAALVGAAVALWTTSKGGATS